MHTSHPPKFLTIIPSLPGSHINPLTKTRLDHASNQVYQENTSDEWDIPWYTKMRGISKRVYMGMQGYSCVR